jgi:hypothetical protein
MREHNLTCGAPESQHPMNILGSLMMIVFLLSTAFRVHHFWTDTDPAVKATETTMFMKNIAIVGGALITFVLFRTASAGWTLTGPLF